MTKQEAIQAMSEGKKVRHRYFSSDEWVKLTPTGLYQFEDGVVCPSLQFWADRSDPSWLTDWEISNN